MKKEGCPVLTFEDLDVMVNKWICELPSWIDTFCCQAKGEREFSNVTRNTLVKVDGLLTRLRLVEMMQENLDDLLNNIRKNNELLECVVEKLEEAIGKECHCCDAVDQARIDVFRLADSIFCALNCFQSLVDETSCKVKVYEKEILKEPLDKIIQIMVSQLGNLQRIETKAYKIEDEIQVSESLRKLILNKYNLVMAPEKFVLPKCCGTSQRNKPHRC